MEGKSGRIEKRKEIINLKNRKKKFNERKEKFEKGIEKEER